jgi:hypothetical protein
MLKIAEISGMVMAADTRATIRAIDQALLEETRRCASVLASDTLGNLPVAQSQTILESMTRSFERLVASRADMLDVTRRLSAIQNQTDLQITDNGWSGDPQGKSRKSAAADSRDPSGPARFGPGFGR